MAPVRICVTAQIKEGKLDEYKNYHDNIWAEVTAGLQKHGVKTLNIYQMPGTMTLVMIITFENDEGKDLGTALGPGSAYRAVEKCKEWEEMMAGFTEDGWKPLDSVHTSDTWPKI